MQKRLIPALFFWVICTFLATEKAQSQSTYPIRRQVECRGWTLHVSEELFEQDAELLKEAIELLEKQLEEIIRVVPEAAVLELKKVPLWISAPYPNTRPGAEYHPDALWLKDHGRDPAMAKGIEFSNVSIFAEETRRMPNFALHELAHAYHDRVLPDGFGNKRIRQAYEKVKANGIYDSVEQRFGDGRSKQTKAYALTTPQEYFAECTEAYFSTNDFYPFTLEQLRKHDSEFTDLLTELWGVVDESCPPLPDLIDRPEPIDDWKHSGSIWINTTADGAPLDRGIEIVDFPICVRLYGDRFPFSESLPDGADVRFLAGTSGEWLTHEIETWDPKAGLAVIWVRIPILRGNDRQELKLYWGNPNAARRSFKNRVFDASNGFVTVWHFGDEQVDSTGQLEAIDTGTVKIAGPVGSARGFSSGNGINLGTAIEELPEGASPHTTEAWIRVEEPNATILAWGNEKAQGKVMMQYRSPSRIHMDCYFSGANIATNRMVPLKEWKHIVHTYSPEATRIYVDGRLAQEELNRTPRLAIERPARFFIGGWYDRYDYHGAIDEVRISAWERDANWIRLQYENQKPTSSLVGMLVRAGDELRVSPERTVLDEGQTQVFEAIADGAEKISWILHRAGREELLQTDRLTCPIDSGRVVNDETWELELRGLYPAGNRSVRVPIEIRERIPEPEILSIDGPITWDDRSELVLTPEISNRSSLEAKGRADLVCEWTTSGVAVASRTEGERLVLTRAQGDGDLQVHLKAHNGGSATGATKSIRIRQPNRDQESWLPRSIGPKERPHDGQFIPRHGWGDSRDRKGTIVYSGSLGDETSLPWTPDQLLLRVFKGDQVLSEQIVAPKTDARYTISAEIPAGLETYRCELIAMRGADEKRIHQATDLMCGDVYLIIGQSNAVATDYGADNDPATSKWVRTFGSSSSHQNEARREFWGDAVARADGGDLAIGYWGLELGKELVRKEQIPVCILNGGVGGTRIDQHQRSAKNRFDPETIYGRLLWRVHQAGLTHGVRGIFWHQGENDQGADGPTNRFGYETYESYFVALSAAWKEDYPNVEHYFAFQIWPKACAMGFDGSDDRLREVQRRLPRLFSNLSIVSSLGIRPPGGCHYPAEGYAEFSKLLLPLVEQKIYGVKPSKECKAPNLLEAYWDSSYPDHRSITLRFDSEMTWNDRCIDQFFLGDERLRIESGFAEGNQITLRCRAPVHSEGEKDLRLAYIRGDGWSQEGLLRGSNGIAAFSFCDVPVGDPAP